MPLNTGDVAASVDNNAAAAAHNTVPTRHQYRAAMHEANKPRTGHLGADEERPHTVNQQVDGAKQNLGHKANHKASLKECGEINVDVVHALLWPLWHQHDNDVSSARTMSLWCSW